MALAEGHRGSRDGLRRLLRPVLNALLPPRCLDCGAVVHGETALCAGCWPRFDFIGPPFCACCGFPFAFDPGPGEPLCAACIARPPSYRRARAVLSYGEASRQPILDFKHGDRTGLAPAFGRWLARAGAGLVTGADFAIPVPLHRGRLFERRYNQSAMLALALGRVTGMEMRTDLLARRRATPSQGRLSPSARRRNVRGAFAMTKSSGPAVEGRHILLIDDVYTTGATAEECARVLRRAGAAAVDVLTLARVVRPRAG